MFHSKQSLFSNLAPQAVAFLKQLDALNVPPVEQIPVEIGRDSYEKLSRYQGGVPVSMARVEDRFVISPHRKDPIPIRIYWPSLHQLPVLLYFHGGGWSRGSLNTHDALCRRLAKAANCIIVSVDYRLAPENPFPAGLDDARAVYAWCLQHAASIGAHPNHIAIGGDSAGGNLSAALTSELVENKGILPAFQMLIYPSLDLTFSLDSVRLYGDGFFLTQRSLEFYASNYAKHQSLKDWRISPLFFKKLAEMPPAIILTADCDPIRDDGIQYAQKLGKAGIRVHHKNIPGVFHAFMQLIETFPLQTEQAYHWLGDHMKKLWSSQHD